MKLGLRMLVKQPGLTLVAVLALGVGIPAGLGPTHFINAALAPLPVDEGDRIPVLRNFNVATSRPQATSQDFVRWREKLTTFEALGAATIRASFNVISDDGQPAPVRGAEVTASTFDILRVPPLLGRTLLRSDEMIGAPAVAVIGYDLWQSRLDADPEVVGRAIRIGGLQHTVVGVMPEDFLFPFRDNLWLPLRIEALGEGAGTERAHLIFGRLADGVSSEEAQAELTTVGRRMALEFPDTHAQLRPEVVRFSIGFLGLPRDGVRGSLEIYLTQVLAFLVLVVACGNVAMLIFTRTVARRGELAVRTALGASRTRVISQLFTEALVFSVLAAGLGLLFGDWLWSQFQWMVPMLPYWVDLGVTGRTVLWAFSLAAVSAGLVSVVPALKVTGKAVQQNIQRAAAGRSGVRFGGMSSALIVVDVALAVATVAVSVGMSDRLRAGGGIDIQDERFLSAQLTIPRIGPAADGAAFDQDEFMARVAATQGELVRRLEAEPGVRGVAVGSVLPRMNHPWRQVEVEGEGARGDSGGRRVKIARVDPDFFDALGQPILSGRGFDSSDLGGDRPVVIVNTNFVERVLGGRNAIGRRVRYATSADEEPGPWHEIVGVVGDLGMDEVSPGEDQGLYHPSFPGEIDPVWLAIHVGDDPQAFTSRLRVLASEVDPTAIVSDPVALDEVRSGDSNLVPWIRRGAVALTVILIALGVSGIYALMSFTVAERTREMGIRAALGAQRSSIAFTIMRRALVQLGVGVLLGLPIAAWRLSVLKGEMGSTHSPIVLALVLGAGVMLVIGALACTAPTLRALRIMPTEALREGG